MSSLWIAPPAIVFLTAVVAMGLFRRRNHMPVDGKTVLVTGGSEGFGKCVACQLSAKGANVVIVSRTARKLEAALADIAAAALHPDRQRFHYVAADVGTPDYAAPVLAEATRWNEGRAPDVVWCIAGTSLPGLFAESPLWTSRHQMDVNYFGSAEMAHAVLREWLAPDAPVEAEPRHLIFTSSVAAFSSVAGYTPYSPSKWAVRALADGLSQEVLLYPQNVAVHHVAPGTMITACTPKENATKPEITHILEKTDPVFEPEYMAAHSIAALERGDFLITVGLIPNMARWGALGSSLRNNWIVDTLTAMLMPLAWAVVLLDMLGKIRKFAREHDHPRTYALQPKQE